MMCAQIQSMKFVPQEYQDECIKHIMDAVESNSDDGRLVTVPNAVYHEKFEHKPGDNRIDVLMETGTGKTFVYIQTIFEMNKRFQKTKFIIVVPRASIRSGVRQNINLTGEYFRRLYGKRLNHITYPESGQAGLINFISTNDLTVLLITNSSFNKDTNLINSPHETLDGTMTIWQRLADLAPVVIIDEPHLLAGKRTLGRLEDMRAKSLFMRFGATYPKNDISNVVHVLDSITAFKNNLVKKICVHVVDSRSENEAVRVLETLGKKEFRMEYTINGQRHEKNVRLGEDLGAVTRIPAYNGRTATNIISGNIMLDDGECLISRKYALTDHDMRQMVRRTIELHFEREMKMFDMGIKTLSLFFIPKISDFKGKMPRIRMMFEKEYRTVRRKVLAEDIDEKYREYLERDYEDGKLKVCDGYFSGDKGSKDKQEMEAVDKILNDKTTLLSIEEPLRFVFSVWALQEGWDNPNVFNICKLSHTSKDTSRRQQVGRGLRIAVDQRGERMTEENLAKVRSGFGDVNELNMVISAHEEEFVKGIQDEIRVASSSTTVAVITLDSLKRMGLDETESPLVYVVLLQNGIIDVNGNRIRSVQDFLESNRESFKLIGDERYAKIVGTFQDDMVAVTDAREKRKLVKIRPSKWNEFRKLWESINRDSHIVYRDVDDDDIINIACEEFDAAIIHPVKNKVRRYAYDPENDSVDYVEETIMGNPDYFAAGNFDDSVMKIARDNAWPIGFLLKLFNRINVEKFKNNPAEAEKQLVRIVREAVHHVIVEKVEYEFAETSVYGNRLQENDGSVKKSLPYTELGKKYLPGDARKEFLYDTIVYDSEIEKESIRNDPMTYTDGDKMQTITVFAKLPPISIPTPFKEYNPDFAYLVSDGSDKTLFLVVETKGYDMVQGVSDNERKKIEYGRKFFESLQKTLPDNMHMCFEKRLNVSSMSAILKECCAE